MRVIEGYGALPAFGLLNQLQVGDTGPAESTRQGNLQRVGLLFLGSRDSQNYSGHKCGTGRKQPNSCDLRAQELSSATKDSDGRKQAALQKLLAHNTTGSVTEAVGARDDRQFLRDQKRLVVKSSSQRFSRDHSIL